MNQVVTITPDGGVSGLQRKRGRGLDLKAMGHAEVERVSEVSWDTIRQRWYVVVHGPMTGEVLRYDLIRVCGLDFSDVTGRNKFFEGSTIATGSGWYLFEDYDDAVAAEVRFLDALRVTGVF